MNEIILINKPSGLTSRDVINKLSKILKTKKIGHTGTLDPLATGVLVVCVNRYTKLVNDITCLDKEYITTIKLGIATDSLDITGNIINKNDNLPKKEEIIKVLNSFLGKSNQEVPKYSAIKINGKKLYEYARNNIEVNLPIHVITISDIELINFIDDEITFRVKVSKGTYIRSLIRDICYKLNTVGTMKSLIRTKQGAFDIKDCCSVEDVELGNYKSLHLKEVFDYKRIDLSENDYLKVINGNKLEIDESDQKVILYYKDEEVAIYEIKNKIMNPVTMIKIN